MHFEAESIHYLHESPQAKHNPDWLKYLAKQLGWQVESGIRTRLEEQEVQLDEDVLQVKQFEEQSKHWPLLLYIPSLHWLTQVLD